LILFSRYSKNEVTCRNLIFIVKLFSSTREKLGFNELGVHFFSFIYSPKSVHWSTAGCLLKNAVALENLDFFF